MQTDKSPKAGERTQYRILTGAEMRERVAAWTKEDADVDPGANDHQSCERANI